MPNIVGLWAPARTEREIRATLGRQLDAVRTGVVAYTEHVFASDGFGVALQDHGIFENGPQPATSPDGRWVLVFDGELLNAAELQLRYVGRESAERLAAPALSLRLVLEHGPMILAQFNGLFCFVLYDRSERRVALASDRFAYRPLFFAHRPDATIFASELKGVIAADPAPLEVDELGTLELFCYGHQFHGTTWLRGYRRILPARLVRRGPDGDSELRYWRYRYDESAPTLDQPSYVVGCAKLIDHAVERCMQGSRRVGIFLSAGYDSRAVAAAIRSHHMPIPAVTFGEPASRDVRFAPLLARRLGLEHHCISEGREYLLRHAHGIVWRTEGMLRFSLATSIAHHHELKRLFDIFLTGFLGEFSGSHTWPRLLLARSRRAALDAIWERFVGCRLEAVRPVFRAEFFDRQREALRQRFVGSFDVIADDHPLNVADSWNFVCLHPHATWHAPSVDRHLLEARAPLLDADLVAFQLAIPPLARIEQRVYKKVIAYAYPAIRDVPCTNSARPIEPRFAREYARLVAAYAWRKAVAPLRGRLLARDPLHREIRNLANDFRAEPGLVTELLEPLLRAGVFDPRIFDAAGIRSTIEAHYSRRANREDVLANLISWGIAAKYFLLGDRSDVPPELRAG